MIRFSFHVLRRAAAVMLMLSVPLLQPPAWASDPETPGGRFSALDLYQRFVSNADGQRCPMYPSCSHYARQAFGRQGTLQGWILTCDRLLRCGRDETRLSQKRQGGVYDPLEANTFWWDKKQK